MSATIHATVVRRHFRVRFDKVVRLSTYQPGGGGVADHGLLLGLDGDDHPQYLTEGRGDARYYGRDHIETALNAKADAAHGHAQLHTHPNGSTLNAIPDHGAAASGQVLTRGDMGLQWADMAQGSGSGDMLASVYDADGDGVVDAAASAGTVPWSGVSDKPSAYPPQAHDHSGVYDPAGAASAEVAGHEAAYDHEGYDSHTASTSNPHGVTAAQVNADPSGAAAGAVSQHELDFDHTQIGSGSGVSDHGSLSGLADDDHPQYHTDARGDARYEQLDATILRQGDLAGSGAATTPARSDHDHAGAYESAGTAGAEVANHEARQDNPHGVTAAQVGADASGAASAEVAEHETTYDHEGYDSHTASTSNPHAVTAAQVNADPSGAAAGAVSQHELDFDHTQIGSGSGVSDHGSLSGLAEDDHAQYHTDSRGDARYYTRSEADAGFESAGAVAAHEATYDHTQIGSGASSGGSSSLDGFTATEAVSPGEVVVINEGTQDVTPVQEYVPVYTFEELVTAYYDPDGAGGANDYTYAQLHHMSGNTYLLTYQRDLASDRAEVRSVTITRTGVTFGASQLSSFNPGSYLQSGKLSSSSIIIANDSVMQVATLQPDGSIALSAEFSPSFTDTPYGTTGIQQITDGQVLVAYAGEFRHVWAFVLDYTSGSPVVGGHVKLSTTGLSAAAPVAVDNLGDSVFLISAAGANTAIDDVYVSCRISGNTVLPGDEIQKGDSAVDRATVVASTRISGTQSAMVVWSDDAEATAVVVQVADDLTITVNGEATPVSSARGTLGVAQMDSENFAVFATDGDNGTTYFLRNIKLTGGVGVSWDAAVNSLSPSAYTNKNSYQRVTGHLHNIGQGAVVVPCAGAICVYRNAYTGVSTSNIDGALGVIDTGGAALAAVSLWPLGEVADSFTGLTPGVDYYLDVDGTVSTAPSPTGRYLGTAVSATKMLTVPMILNRLPPHIQGTDDRLAAGTVNEVTAAEIRYALSYEPWAAQLRFDHTVSGLTATTVQTAIDELKALIDSLHL